MRRFRIMLRKLVIWLGVFVLVIAFFLLLTYAYLASQTGEKADGRLVFNRRQSTFLVFAHRGASGLVPENTIEAFAHSARQGADVLEMDVRATSDGTLVVIHDSDVARTTNGNGGISAMPISDAKMLDAGYRFTSDGGQTYPFRGKGVTIPSLREAFDAFPTMTFNIEPKQSTPSIAEPLCTLARERKMTERIIVASFVQTTLDDFRKICPEIATSASPSEASKFLAMSKTKLGPSYSPPMQALQVPEKIGAVRIVSKQFVAAAHERNLKVYVWTVNETADMQRLIDMGVDGIMTNYPDRLLNLLGRTVNVK